MRPAITTTFAADYRPEVDGLRALAVIGVIIAHFDNNILPSGFLGVDMFFVISGYVITQSLYRSNSRTLTEFLVNFYERRIKRLVPALILCVLVTATLICLFNPNPNTSLKTGMFALFGLSNIYLFDQATDYFGTAAKLNVFTHTWSLGVEEQFYLLFPFLLWFAGIGHIQQASRKTASILLGVLTVISLAAFLILSHINQPAAYFLMPTRFWELSAGALLFLVLYQRQPRPLTVLSTHLPTIVTVGLIAVFLMPEALSVYTTPAIVLLTVLLIGSLRQQTSAYALFAHPLTVHIGLISYSLYLWHWSVLTLSRWTIGIDWWTVPLQIALIVALAEGSYRYLEKPLRHAQWSSSQLRTIGVGLTTLGSSALVLVLLGGVLDIRLYTGTQPRLAAVGIESLTDVYVMPDGQSSWRGEDCILSDNREIGKVIPIDGCTLGDFDSAKRRILVLGNSFSASFVQAFDELVLSDQYAVTIASAWATPPVPEVPHVGVREKVVDYYWRSVAPSLMSNLREGDLVFLVSDMARLSPAQSSSSTQETLAQLETGLIRLSEELAQRGIRLAILNGIPFTREAMCEPVVAAKQWFAPFGGPCTFYTKEQTLERRASLDALLSALEQAGRLRVVDLTDFFCPGEICTYHGENDVLLYRDAQSHPSVEAVQLAAPQIRKQLIEFQ